jgi:uncharacterized protein
VLVDEGLELLTEAEARALLASEDLGRVGVTMGALPVILPVNYVVIDGDIYFRTSAGSKLNAATANAVVAFEVDQRDRSTRTGWSVLAVGICEQVLEVELLLRAAATGLEPDADGRRGHLVRIRPELISGRRIVHGPAASEL